MADKRRAELAERPVPGGIDVSRPNIARVCDALLGGKDNFAVLRDAMPPGSYLAISSFRMPGPEMREKTIKVEKLLTENLGTGRWREDEEILGWFGDWELLKPEFVPLAEWRPVAQGPTRKDDTYYKFSGGVAKKQ